MLSGFEHVVSVSAKTGEISALRRTVESLFDAEEIDLWNDAIVANARQYAALSRAAKALDAAVAALDAGVPLDAASVEAELAMAAIGEVDGRAVSEDIVADIFSHFCVGK